MPCFLESSVGLNSYVILDSSPSPFGSNILDFIFVSILCDICLHFTHRSFHTSNYLYQKFHIKHHKKYVLTFSAIHHVFPDIEGLALGLGGVLPFIILYQCFDLYIFLAQTFFVQISNIIGHSGYMIPSMPRWFPIFNPHYHDQHHKFYNVNFAATYLFTDAIFGTLKI